MQLELVKRLNEVGFERTRRAVAALALSVFVFLYLLVSFNPPEGFRAVFIGLTVCYGVAFLGVAAEWFWGRWFASGLGWSGVMVAIASFAMIGWTPALAIYGGLHLLVVVLLLGKKMADRYDMQEAWRQRYSMDEYGVARLRKTVTRAAASLPSVIFWALGPRNPDEGSLAVVGGLAALALAVVGVRGLVRLRTWGVLALTGSLALVAATGHVTAFSDQLRYLHELGWLQRFSDFIGSSLGALFLGAAVLPFALPVTRFLARRRTAA
jgi:hypothetical protein